MDLKEWLIRGLAVFVCIILLIYTAYWGVNQMRLRLRIDFRDYAIEVSHDPLNMGFGYDLLGLPDFKALAAEVDEAIRILDSGDVAGCLERCRRIVAEIRRSRAFGDIAMLVEPFIDHADEYELDKKGFTEGLKEYLGYLGMALRELAGEEVESR